MFLILLVQVLSKLLTLLVLKLLFKLNCIIVIQLRLSHPLGHILSASSPSSFSSGLVSLIRPIQLNSHLVVLVDLLRPSQLIQSVLGHLFVLSGVALGVLF